MVRTLLLMLALVAAFILQDAPLRAVPAEGAALSCHQPVSPQPFQHGAPLPDRHICIGCAIPAVAAPLPVADPLPGMAPQVAIPALGSLDAPALDPPPPRNIA